jgi:hypothetical protein
MLNHGGERGWGFKATLRQDYLQQRGPVSILEEAVWV